MWEAAKNSAAGWVLQNPFSFHAGVDGETIVDMAKSFDVDVKRDWRIERDFLELLSKDQLSALVSEWKTSSHKAWRAGGPRNKRIELIDRLIAVGVAKRLPCPKALLVSKKPNNFYF